MSELVDISSISLGERKDHYRKSFGAHDMPMTQQRVDVTKMADDEARDEMLQEIHSMLLHLVNKS